MLYLETAASPVDIDRSSTSRFVRVNNEYKMGDVCVFALEVDDGAVVRRRGKEAR